MFAKLLRAFDPSFGHGKKVFGRQFYENMDMAIELGTESVILYHPFRRWLFVQSDISYQSEVLSIV